MPSRIFEFLHSRMLGISRVLCRSLTHQFKKRRNWRRDLDRACVLEEMDLKEYFDRESARESARQFKDLTPVEYDQFLARRAEKNAAVAKRIAKEAIELNTDLMLTNIDPETCLELSRAILKIEQHSAFDRDSMIFFQSLGKLRLLRDGQLASLFCIIH